jgi:two-component system, LuxR family, response regulator FixJ
METHHKASTVYIVHQDMVVTSLTVPILKRVGINSLAFQSPGELLQTLPLLSPGCLLVDFMLPEMGGIQLMAELRRRNSFHPIIFMSSRVEPALIVQAMNQGGFGFVKRPFQHVELLDMVQRALAKSKLQYAAIDTGLAYRLRHASLTGREHEVLRLFLRGFTARQAGERLGISHRTVEHNRVKIFEKLEVSNMSELSRLATVSKMLDLFI